MGQSFAFATVLVLASAHAALGTTCTLRASGPVQATADNQVIELLDIDCQATAVPCITVSSFRNVTIRNVRVTHGTAAPGMQVAHADGLRIVNASVQLGASSSASSNSGGGGPVGPLPSSSAVGIDVYGTAELVIERVRTASGSSGIYAVQCPGARLAWVEAHNARGPFPRGQCVQLDKCDGALLEDFSCVNGENVSFTEDNISVFESDNVTVRRGLIDGNNSPSGDGVMVESGGKPGLVSSGLVEDVDAVNQGNGCFGGWGVSNVVFSRCRVSKTHCVGWGGRGKPSSGALVFAGGSEGTSPKVDSSGLRIEGSIYDQLCVKNLVWPAAAFASTDLAAQPFAPRTPFVNTFCWELGAVSRHSAKAK